MVSLTLLSAFCLVRPIHVSADSSSHHQDDDQDSEQMVQPERADVPTIEEIRYKLSQSPYGTLHVVGSVTIDDARKSEIFKYVTNLENDVHWYPGTLSSHRASGHGGPGTIYNEVVSFFNQQIPVKATVLRVHPSKSFWFTSDGVFTNLTNYRVVKVSKGKVKLTVDSTVEASNGVTKEFFGQYLTLTLQTLLTTLGKTGTVQIEN